MSANKNPFDEHFHRRLSDLESPIPDNLFDRLQARRGGALPSDAPIRERLETHESPVSATIFDAVLTERERRRRRRIVLWRTVTGIAALWLLVTLIFEFKNKNEGVNKLNDAALNRHNSTLEKAKINENTEGSLKVKSEKLEVKSEEETAQKNENTEGSSLELNTSLRGTKQKNEALNTPNSELKNGEINSELNTNNPRLNKLNSDNNSVNNKDLKKQITINKKADLNKKSMALNYSKTTKTQSNNTISSTNSENNAEFKNNNSTLNNTKTIVNSENTEGSNSELKNNNLALNTPNNSVLNNTKTIANNGNNTELNNAKISVNSENTDLSRSNREGSNSELNDRNKALENALENRLSSPNFQTPTLDFLHILDVKTVPFLVEKRDNPCADPENGCPTFGGRQRGMRGTSFYVDAFVAPEYMMRRFKPNLVESEKLLAARDSIEKTQYAVSTGVRASVVFENGMSLRAGVAFNQMNEKAQFDSLGIGSIRTTYDVRIVNGKPDTVSITTTIIDGIFRKTRHNRYRSIDIPLQLGYEIATKNGWTFGLNGGVNFNITAWRKADIVGTDLRQQTVSSDINAPNPVFKNNLGISIIGSVAAYRQLSRGLQLVIEPSVRYGLQPITRSDYALKQQYSTVGLIVGLRLRL
jgi:hypothetical protein